MEQENAVNEPQQQAAHQARQPQQIPIAPKTFAYPLLWNVHRQLTPLTVNGTGVGISTYCTLGNYAYFNSECDGILDSDWGGGYRTLQIISSWIFSKREPMPQSAVLNRVPTISEIQNTFSTAGSKLGAFRNSTDWIGTIEVFYYIEQMYGIKCRVLHLQNHFELKRYSSVIKKYFENFGGIGLISGDRERNARIIAGAHISSNQAYLLIVDPNYVGQPRNADELIAQGRISWRHTSEFVDSSFYNICLPLLK